MVTNGDNTGEYGSTPYYHLPLYMSSTPQDLRDGYNRAMRLIDQKLHQIDVQQQIKGQK